jgi:pilus assembly protein Flp/PilA
MKICISILRRTKGERYIHNQGDNQSHHWRQCAAPVGNIRLTDELKMKKVVTRFAKDEFGVSAIEYGLIAALVSILCIAAMTTAGTQLKAVYTQIGHSLTGALGGAKAVLLSGLAVAIFLGWSAIIVTNHRVPDTGKRNSNVSGA